MSSGRVRRRDLGRRDLVLVTAGLELDGGGRALAGRLLAQGIERYARRAGLGFEVLSLGRSRRAEGTVPSRLYGGSRPALAAAVLRRQLSPRPALLFDLLGLARAVAPWPRPALVPYGVFLHGIEVWRPLAASARRALAGARLLLVNSAYTRERARPFLPAAAPEPDLLPLALEDRPAAGEIDTDVLAASGQGFLLIVGRMATSERYKGHDMLLEALVTLRRTEPAARLVVVGEGDDRPRLEARTRELGLAEGVRFTGFVSEATLTELYARSTALVMPSRGEGFGLVYLEAMRAGRPCVAARGSAAEELIEDGENGLLVDADDPASLAQALARLLAAPELAARLGSAGRQRFESRHRFDHFAERLAPYLDRLTGL